MKLEEVIVLSARPADSLQWHLDSVSKEKILWEFDLGLADPFFPLEDEMHFHALSLALEKFSREIWPFFQEKTAGAILYRGSADLKAHFSWSERQKENWKMWLGERAVADENHLRRLFCADAFAYYFQMLSHRLPDELPLYLLIDVEGVGSLAETHQLLSKERFEHFLVVPKGLPFWSGLVWENDRIQTSPMPQIGLCFPEERYCSREILQKIDHWMSRYQKPFRVLSEAFLTEEWEGIDELHIFPEALSPQGERKLKGFQAAGGMVVMVVECD